MPTAIARGEELFVHLNRLCENRPTSANPRPAVEPTLPMPMVNMISGGLHAGGNLDIQDVLIIPIGAASYSEALEMTVALYRATGAVLKERGFESDLVGDEGGYGPRLHGNEQAFEVVVDAMIACGFEPGATSRSPWMSPRATSSTRIAGPTAWAPKAAGSSTPRA